MESQEEPAEPPRRARGGPRLYHTKSRTGCVRCRARRVKCDESRPICNNCHRHNVTCEYDRLGGTRSTATPGPSAASTAPPTVSTPACLSPASVPSSASSAASEVAVAVPGALLASPASLHAVYWEMRALHHYTLSTSRTLPGYHIASIAECWEARVPVLALANEPLLRALVALALLHLMAEGERDASLAHCRAAYLDAALRAHRQGLTASLRDSQSANVVCFTSILLLVDSFATLHERPLEPYAPPTQWLWIVKGTRSIFEACYPLVQHDPHSSIMALITTAHFFEVGNIFTQANAAAFEYLLPVLDAPGASDLDRDPAVLQAYQTCVTYLGSIWTAVQAGEHVMGLCRRIMAFPCATPALFLQLVEQRIQRALVILAHFFAMTVFARQIWWIGDIALREVQGIYDHLEPDMRLLMDFPIKTIGDLA